MRIAIDMQGLQTQGSKGRGVGRYVHELVLSIIKQKNPEDEVLIFLNGAFQDSCYEVLSEFDKYLPRKNIKVWDQQVECINQNLNLSLRHKDLCTACSLIREWFILKHEPDVIWCPNLQEGQFEPAVTSVKLLQTSTSSPIWCTTLHDLTPLIDPRVAGFHDGNSPETKDWYLSKLEYVKKSDLIVTVSHFCKDKIQELLGIEKERILVAYNGVNHDRFKVNRNFIKFENKNNEIFFLGPLEKYKNIDVVLEAYSLLPENIKQQYKLSLAGFNIGVGSPIYDKFQHYGIDPQNVLLHGKISDEALVEKLQCCCCCCFPSIYEGFGLPGAEAMACGSLVFLSNSTSVTELAATSNVLFDPFDAKQLSEKICHYLSCPEESNQEIAKSVEKAKIFDWDISAKKILSSNRALIEKREAFHKKKPDLNQLDEDLWKHLRTLTSLNDDDRKQLTRSIHCMQGNFESQGKTIFLNVGTLVHHDDATGIQRVVRALAVNGLALSNQERHIQLVYANQNDMVLQEVVLEKNKLRIPPEGEIFVPKVGDVVINLELAPEYAFLSERLIKTWNLMGVGIYFVLYDLIPVQYPMFYPTGFVNAFEKMLHSFSYCTGVISISETVQNLYLDWKRKYSSQNFKQNNFYFYLGADMKSSLPSGNEDEFCLPYCLTDEYFLVVSTLEPRKSHLQVLKAFEELNASRQKPLKLVFVGKRGWLDADSLAYIEKAQSKLGWFYWYERVTDKQLEAIYKNCRAVINASLEEGFGLPIIEAAFYGKPVILRDIPVFRELVGSNAVYFSGMGPKSLANSIEEWLAGNMGDMSKTSPNISWLSWKESTLHFLEGIKNS